MMIVLYHHLSPEFMITIERPADNRNMISDEADFCTNDNNSHDLELANSNCLFMKSSYASYAISGTLIFHISFYCLFELNILL